MLKEVVEVAGLPLAAMVVASTSRPGEEMMVVRAGSVPAGALRYCNRVLTHDREMAAAGRWS